MMSIKNGNDFGTANCYASLATGLSKNLFNY